MSEETYSFLCPSCSAHLSVPVSMAGVSGPCPYCASEITSPMPQDVPTDDLEVIRTMEAQTATPPTSATPPPEDSPVPWEDEKFPKFDTGAVEYTTGTAATIERPPAAATSTASAPASKQSKKQRKLEKNTRLRDRRERQEKSKSGPAVGRSQPAAATATAATRGTATVLTDVPAGMSLFSKLCLGAAGVALVAIGSVFGLPMIMGDDGQEESPSPGSSGQYAVQPSVPPKNDRNLNDSPPLSEPPLAGNARAKPNVSPSEVGVAPDKGAVFPEIPELPAEDSQDVGEGVDPSIPDSLTEFTPSPDSPLVAPREALEKFLMANNWQERMQYCIGGKTLEKTLKTYYSGRIHGGQMEPIDISYTYHETDPDNTTQFFLFTVSFEIDENGQPVFLEIPVVVEQQNGKCLVEWETFAEFKDRHLRDFIEERVLNQPKKFHVVMERAHYHDDDPELNGKLDSGDYYCIKVESPNPDDNALAFLHLASSAGKALRDKLTWPRKVLGEAETPYVELTWKATATGTRYLEVTKLLAEKWRTPRN